MTDAVLDSSAILAVLNSEPGQDVVLPLLRGARVSTLIVAETATVLIRRGWPSNSVLRSLGELELSTYDFTLARAIAAGLLTSSTSEAGLSLADRACVALALELRLPVFTADRAWSGLHDLDLDLRLFR